MSTLTKATLTPAPWRDEAVTQRMADEMRGPQPQDFLIVGSDGTVIGILYDFAERCPANARLIAASPLMYDYVAKRAAAGDAEAAAILEGINASGR